MILVTGGSGRIARRTAVLLHAQGVPLRLMSRSPNCCPTLPGVETVFGDFENEERRVEMAKSEIEKVLTVFKGVTTGDADLAARYMNPVKYIEHNPHVANGVEGLKEFFSQIAADDHHLEAARIFQDGAYVFAQSEGLILGQNIFFDIFRFEGGLIVEHWGFSAKAAPPNRSGHTQIDGPTQANDSENTQENKAFVRSYYETIHILGDHSNIPQYFSGDHCIRHEPGVRDGVVAFMHDLEIITRNRSIDEIELVLGQGDFVFIAAKGTVDGDACSYIDLYRVEHGKIAERWGFSEKVPPREKWKNDNGPL